MIIPDQDRERFAHQARLEGLTFSAWMRAVAHDRLEESQRSESFESPEQVEEFFRKCDALPDPYDYEPDWEEHLQVIAESRRRGYADA